MRAARLSVIFCLALISSVEGRRQAQQPPTFRSRVTVVPLDVRVVDREGKPISDLKQSDFTILEDGVPQQIVHFMFNTIAPAAPPEEDQPLAFRQPLGDTITPQNQRIFLFVLGRGRQLGPVKGVEAAMQFVKERLLPQDRVAILAYNRATDFTTDHQKVFDTLERYWKKHEWIEARLAHHFSGLAAAYASPDIPQRIQTEIDAIFRASGALTSRHVDATGISDAAAIAADERRNRDLIQRAELAAERIKSGIASPFDELAMSEAAMLPENFDEYVQKSFDTRTDLGNLYAGIRYLRLLDGEKHLVFLTPNGLFLPRAENGNSLAALANDARVAVDIIHTYGTSTAGGFGQMFQNMTSGDIATLTGGQMTTARRGEGFFLRLDDSTRAQYLLGYSPSNTTWDGKYRRVEVKVNRKSAQVLYRHGYIARHGTTPLDRQQYLMYMRVASAANVPRDIDDLKIALGQPITMKEGRVTMVKLRVGRGTLTFKRGDKGYVGKIEVVAFCADGNGRLVGEMWNTIELDMTEQNHQRFMTDGATFTLTMEVRAVPRFVRVVVYDHTSDLVGSAKAQMKR